MNTVESFTLDHDKVTAPYVRKAKVVQVDPRFPECLISKFDVRFAQPNEECLENGALHTLEHFFAIFIREYTDDLIDISPMGCRTGFYFIFSGDKDVAWVASLVRRALTAVGTFEGAIPGGTRKECGNYREHDLVGAKEWSARFIAIPEAEVIKINRLK